MDHDSTRTSRHKLCNMAAPRKFEDAFPPEIENDEEEQELQEEHPALLTIQTLRDNIVSRQTL